MASYHAASSGEEALSTQHEFSNRSATAASHSNAFAKGESSGAALFFFARAKYGATCSPIKTTVCASRSRLNSMTSSWWLALAPLSLTPHSLLYRHRENVL